MQKPVLQGAVIASGHAVSGRNPEASAHEHEFSGVRFLFAGREQPGFPLRTRHHGSGEPSWSVIYPQSPVKARRRSRSRRLGWKVDHLLPFAAPTTSLEELPASGGSRQNETKNPGAPTKRRDPPAARTIQSDMGSFFPLTAVSHQPTSPRIHATWQPVRSRSQRADVAFRVGAGRVVTEVEIQAPPCRESSSPKSAPLMVSSK